MPSAECYRAAINAWLLLTPIKSAPMPRDRLLRSSSEPGCVCGCDREQRMLRPYRCVIESSIEVRMEIAGFCIVIFRAAVYL